MKTIIKKTNVRTAFFTTVVFFIAICIFLNFLRNTDITNIKEEKEIVINQEWHDHAKAVAYQYGFQRGYISFVKQFQDEFDESKFALDIESFDAKNKAWSYTSNSFQESEEESKGYVDGYHAAADRATESRCTR